jgi:hypothetical protein
MEVQVQAKKVPSPNFVRLGWGGDFSVVVLLVPFGEAISTRCKAFSPDEAAPTPRNQGTEAPPLFASFLRNDKTGENTPTNEPPLRQQ